MFTYLNPEVREKLIDQVRLVRINSEGELMDVKSPDHPGVLDRLISREPQGSNR